MATNNTNAFRAAHPIDFDLFDQDTQNVLYIEDNSDQLLTLDIRNASTQDIVLKDLKDDPLSATNYHFALRFRPGTLSNTSLTGKKAIKLTNHSFMAHWEMLLCQHKSENWDVIYLRKTKELLLKSGNGTAAVPRQTVVFNHVGAEAGAGARGTRVELVCANMHYQNSTDLINTTREIQLGIVNHRGKKHIPLQMGFAGGNTIVNDGITRNKLTLRIANIGHYNELNPTRSNITFTQDTDEAKKTKLILSFQTGTDNESWALDTAAGVLANIEIGSAGWHISKPSQGGKPVWILTPEETKKLPCMADPVKGKESHFDIDINNIISNFPCGQTHLYVHYQNIPGYWDGHIACEIEKTPVKVKQGQLEIHAGNSKEIPVQIVAIPQKSVPLMGFMMQNEKGEQTPSLVMGSLGNENKIESFNRPLLITNRNANNNEVQIARFAADGKVGLGNITSPSAVIDLAAVSGVPALQLRNGNKVYHNNETQIVFGSIEGYDDRLLFGHSIKTRHTSGDSNLNAIDFYVWTQANKPLDVGTKHTLTLSNGKVGVSGITDPQATVDIGASGHNVGLQIQNGNTASDSSKTQIQLGGNNCPHAIKTRHNEDARKGNAIDFHLWEPGNANALPSISINNNKAVAGQVKESDATLDVKGDIRCVGTGADMHSAGLTVDNGNVWSRYKHGGLLVGENKEGFFGFRPGGGVGISLLGNGGWAMYCKATNNANEITIDGRLFITRVDNKDNNKKGDVKHLAYNLASKEVVYDASDERLKKNIAPLPYALETIQQLRGVSYQWNEEGLLRKTKDVEDDYRAASNTPEDNTQLWEQEKKRIRAENTRTFHGFIAQEIEAVFPEWVKEDNDGYKTINIDELAPVMVEAIKAQQQQITNMQSQIEFLMKEVAALRAGR